MFRTTPEREIDVSKSKNAIMEEAKKNGLRWIGGVEPPTTLLTATGIQILEIECREQPGRLRELIHAYRSDSEIRAELMKLRQLARREGPVLFIGMGASYCSSAS